VAGVQGRAAWGDHRRWNAVYQLLMAISGTQLVGRQAPALVGSVVIAELFYKFHSFTLECAAFLMTWFVIDLVVQMVASRLKWTWATAGH
jgi:hypothetical protein